ncbi:putative E3 ubiquitin-protein ligase LIN isoform X2 [Cryptomeria japonica]|uniref:putative E3 ubiquitin-protein ligase LIN isoform X2 n=1 Tax=Cryptomeria japonica TaxID=3369 RepID=UPI0027DA2778|nr:putative E3 ubiquitin-protein ligase LIN isoform X2 [Cryptomeria japonica]
MGTGTKNSNIVRSLVKTIGFFIDEAISNEDQRLQNKEQINQRLSRHQVEYSGGSDQVQHAEEAVIASLYWGMEAIEEAMGSNSKDIKMGRLDYAEKMLQACALLNVKDGANNTTAGVPNCYLAAWANLNLALVSKFRKNDRVCIMKTLEMFMVDPQNSRLELAPTLWEDLFLRYLSSIVGWYGEQRYRILETVLPDDNFGVSVSCASMLAFDELGCKALLSKMSVEQAKQLQRLEKVYQDSLDENTMICVKFYEEWLDYDMQKLKGKPGDKPCVKVPVFQGQFGSKTGFDLDINSVFEDGFRVKRMDEAECARNGRYNPIWEDYDDESRDYNINRRSASFQWRAKSMPRRVTPQDMMTSEEISNTQFNFQQKKNSESTKLLTTPSIRSGGIGRSSSSFNSEAMSDDDPDYTGLSSGAGFSNSSEYCSSSFESVLKFKVQNHEKDTNSINQSKANWISNEEKENEACIGDTEPEYEFAVFAPDKIDNSKGSIPKVFPIVATEGDESQSDYIVHSSETSTPQPRPPKDFVCPITSQLFSDPVTLETGQTYERKAIQEWLAHGNHTCPITRQKLEKIALPQTNYLLKRLIAAWKEENPEIAVDFSNSETSIPNRPLASSTDLPDIGSDAQSSPDYSETQTSSQNIQFGNGSNEPIPSTKVVTSESMTSELRPIILCLCTSEDLQECESAILTISRIWQKSKADPSIQNHLNKPAVINGLVEILSNSIIPRVLRAALYILSELVVADRMVTQTLTRVDSDLKVLVSLLKKGLWEAAVLIYQLKPSFSSLASLDLIPVLVELLTDGKEKELECEFQMQLKPKEVAIVLLERILANGNENYRCANARDIISMNGIPALLKILESKDLEERYYSISILSSCVHADGSCRNLIANRAEMAPVLELLRTGSDRDRITAINFISELVRLNRRTFNEQVLRIIKDQDTFSTMHMLLVHLQMPSMEQRSVVASLLLQLDLLEEPRKMSIYREEALDALVEGLKSEEFIVSQVSAAETIVALQGRFSLSGKPLTEALLLKSAGLDESYKELMRAKQDLDQSEESLEVLEEEETAAKDWERRVASVLVTYEFGLMFEALGECLESKSVQLARPSLVAATWLTHMLTIVPDTGVRGAARQCLLGRFVTVLKSHKKLEDRALAALGLRAFIYDSEGLEELEQHANDIFNPLWELKKVSSAATDILRALANHPSANISELWKYEELSLKDTSINGELNSLVHAADRIFSGHSDGTLKVWDCKKRILHLIQEVREHTKSVTSLAVSSSRENLYSGSHDKTIRVWAIGKVKIHCIQVHEVKDHVQALNVSTSLACFISQGVGIKIYDWNGSSKTINSSKNARCLAIAEGKVYYGCSDSTIQEINLESGKSTNIQSGVRKLLGKANPVYALQVYGGLLYVACYPVDGVAVKVWNLSTMSVVGTLSSSLDVRSMVVTNDFLYLGSKFGTIEVWLRDRLMKVGTLHTRGGNSKLVSLAVHGDGELLFSASVDGRIEAWALV